MTHLEQLEILIDNYPQLLQFEGLRLELYKAILTQLKKDKK